MFRNYLAAALRNMARNRLYAAINIVGLAIGFAAAIFAGMFVRDELTFHRWIPGYERTYVIASTFASMRGVSPAETTAAYRDVAAALKLDFPEIEAVTRIGDQNALAVIGGDVHGVESIPPIGAVSPEFFTVVPVPALAGDLHTALDQPDSIVLTRSMARKYFGRDTPVGEILEVGHHPMRVTAVIEDWPSNTGLFEEPALISERASFSALKQWDETAFGPEVEPYRMVGRVFVRLRPGVPVETVERALSAFAARHIPRDLMGPVQMRLIPIAAVHLAVLNNPNSHKQYDNLMAAIYGLAGTGILIVFTAGLNFVNAMTARASRRAVEVGVRKVTGAARRQLVVQFIGEAVAYVVLGWVVAIGLLVVLIPAFQAFVGRHIIFDLFRDPTLVVAIGSSALVMGVLAGIYPAFILASLRPATVLKSGLVKTTGSALIRQILVALQFAILIGLAAVTNIVYRQTHFAMTEGLRYDTDQLLVIENACILTFRDEVLKLPGVKDAGCSAGGIDGGYVSNAVGLNGVQVPSIAAAMDPATLDTLGLKPVAGRFFRHDLTENLTAIESSDNPNVVINEAAVRALGFASPAAAVGQTISWSRRLGATGEALKNLTLEPSRIIGVTADFPYMVSGNLVDPHIFYSDLYIYKGNIGRMFVKLTGRSIPETLEAIDRIWERVSASGEPLRRQFMTQELERNYRTQRQEAKLIAALAGVALFIAALGLFGLSAFTAERRTKEIGVRKALGAGQTDILRLLLWEFSKPVLCANLIAWPVAWFFVRRWLESYAYRIEVSPWVFLAASALAFVVALITVSGQAFLIARAEPVTALRYE